MSQPTFHHLCTSFSPNLIHYRHRKWMLSFKINRVQLENSVINIFFPVIALLDGVFHSFAAGFLCRFFGIAFSTLLFRFDVDFKSQNLFRSTIVLIVEKFMWLFPSCLPKIFTMAIFCRKWLMSVCVCVSARKAYTDNRYRPSPN